MSRERLPAPYPLLLEPILFEKVWGGRKLEHFGKQLPPGKLIGESWELADLAQTSASGAGGGARRSTIANGPLKGRTLHDAIELWGDDLIPRAKLTPTGDFPLLVKLLDARENLSVQVHPSPAYAAANPGAHLKHECWYILGAEPGSVIYKGVKPGATSDAIREAIARGTVANLLGSHPARRGDMHLLPSGTVHALGAGVMVAEIQTPSDTTFRIYDWGRAGRELHVEQALACINFASAVPSPTRLPRPAHESGVQRVTLVRTAHLSIDGMRFATARTSDLTDMGTSPAVLMLIDRPARICGGLNELPLLPGQTVLVPPGTDCSIERLSNDEVVALLATV